MRKGLANGIMILFLFSSVLPLSMGYVVSTPGIDEQSSNRGKTLYVGGGGPDNYTTIQGAIDDAFDGDTVFVYDDSSPYPGDLSINTSIRLVGENKETTIIDGFLFDDVVKINVDNVEIKGFSVTNGQNSGIRIKSNSNEIDGNIFTCNHISVLLSGASFNNLVTGNLFVDNLDGVACVENSRKNLITHCLFINNTGGVCLFNGHKNSIVSNNSFSGNKHDIEFDHLTLWNKICFNNFLGNGIVRHWRFLNLNFYRNNYWYDWKGIGPYYVGGFLNWDWHPASEPYDIGI